MHTTQTVLASLLMVAVVSAQAEPATSARAQVDRLAAEWQAAQNTYRQAIETVQASEAWKAADAAKDRTEMRALTDAVQKPDAAAFGARALAAAQTFTGDDQMLLLLWAANECGDKQTVETAVGRVIESHLKSPLLGDLLENAMTLQRAVGPEQAKAVLKRVVAESPHALPRAWAMYWQAVTIQRDKNATADLKTAAAELLAAAEKLAEGTALADRIAAPRFEAEHLQIGMVAPDIEGEDLDGVAFQLSDYRGKVVVLDFWGFW